MKEAENQKLFELAMQRHQTGELGNAEALYRQVLANEPGHVDALQYLGVILRQRGDIDKAEILIRRAIAIRPDYAPAHSNLGSVLTSAGKIDEAIASFHRAIALNPNMPGAHGNLGVALAAKGLVDQGIAEYRQAISINPNYAEAYFNLGNALGGKKRFDEAIGVYRQAIIIKPTYAQAFSNLGAALEATGKRDEAIAAYRKAIECKPDYAQAHNNLGNALQSGGQFDEAIASYQRALQIKPDFADAHLGLGNAERGRGWPNEALAAYGKAIALQPDFPDAHNNRGNAFKDLGQLDQAIAAYRDAMELRPDSQAFQSNLVLALHYHPAYDDRAIADELARWNERHAEPLRTSIRDHANDPAPDRRLRIGYVSPDFREHVVGQTILPLLEHHDRTQFEITCYSSLRWPDSMTDRLHAKADRWRDIFDQSDQSVAALVRYDQIDILVDLAVHTANNRLRVFARRPAPVQVTYLGYCGSTGMKTVDYRLSDPHLDPQEDSQNCFAETTIRLPRAYWCYRPWRSTAGIERAPILANGFATFGCLNNFAKVSPAALDLWAGILSNAPNSRMIIHAPPGAHLETVYDQFSRHGVSADRLQFVGQQCWEDYTQTYLKIDIALDPFPFGGGITTCDAMWMGVPVVSLSGQTAVGRGGQSILSNLGLTELLASTPDQYARIAVKLSHDSGRLQSLRQEMRARLQASPLMDHAGFTRSLETAYRLMWSAWCKTKIR